MFLAPKSTTHFSLLPIGHIRVHPTVSKELVIIDKLVTLKVTSCLILALRKVTRDPLQVHPLRTKRTRPTAPIHRWSSYLMQTLNCLPIVLKASALFLSIGTRGLTRTLSAALQLLPTVTSSNPFRP